MPVAPPDLDAYLAAARSAVTRAAVITRSVQRSLAGGQTLSKADDSPVTIADFAAQAVVARTLVERLGPIRLVAEESARYLRDPAHAAARGPCLRAAQLVWPEATEASLLEAIDLGAPELRPDPRDEPADEHSFWTLDPIDGTKGFIRGHQYSVCLAYIWRGRPVVAALACPNLSADFGRPFDDPDGTGQTFLATSGSPVWVVPADDARAEPLALEVPAPEGEPSLLARPLRMVGSYSASHGNETMLTRVIRGLERRGVVMERPRRVDSQVKYAVVARGQADIFIRTPRSEVYREAIWDHAAGSLIAERAGCVASDVDGVPLDFGRGARLDGNRGILCARPAAHGLVAAAARDALAAGS